MVLQAYLISLVKENKCIFFKPEFVYVLSTKLRGTMLPATPIFLTPARYNVQKSLVSSMQNRLNHRSITFT